MPKLEYICTNCGEIFLDWPSRRGKSKYGHEFCLMKCKGEYQTKLAEARAPKKTESTCRTCGEKKPISEFYHDSHCRANGYVQYDCKECIKIERQQHYDKNRESVIKRAKKYAAAHPEVARRHGRKQMLTRDPRQQRAIAKVNRELQAGRVIRPERCEKCGARRKLHAHHYNGYEPENVLDVIWVCVRCHHELHGRGPNCREK